MRRRYCERQIDICDAFEPKRELVSGIFFRASWQNSQKHDNETHCVKTLGLQRFFIAIRSKGKMEEKELKTKKYIADVYGSTVQRIEYLVKQGVIQGEGKPLKFDLKPTIKALFKYQKELNKSQNKDGAVKELELDKLEGEARIKQAKAEMEELSLKELRGELHRAKDVEAIVSDSALYLRSMLMALPGQLAVDLAKTDNPAEAADRIKTAVYHILDEMADNYEYNPEKYAERVREREGLKLEEENE